MAPALRAIELPKSTWYYHQNQKVDYHQKYQHLKPLLEQIAQDHPDYGSPRITTELQDTYQQPINHKVVQWLLREWDLSLRRSTHKPKPSPVRQVIVAAISR